MAARFAPLTHDDPREVGGYALRARLGAGGMGRVYLSFTPGGRALAIKVIRPEHAEDEEFRRRFQHEVAAAQRVQGIYTAPVVDADSEAALPWLATAYVPGPSLRQAVAEHGPLPLPSVFRLLAGVAEGLTAIHECGLIHRDLTPANVLLAADGPRVIDFGIAHAAAATSLTRTGLTVGTPAFLSPEQVRGRSATSATDVFALGHLAVVAATGHTAFGEGNQDALLYRIIHEPPDLDDCPHEVRAIAQRCLAKDPAERPTLTEVLERTRAQVHGQTMRLATESWLPPAIVSSLSAYDTAVYTAARTKPETKARTTGEGGAPRGTAGTGREPGTGFDGKSIVQGLAALAALVAFLAIGPEKVFDTIGELFSGSSSRSSAGDTTDTTLEYPSSPGLSSGDTTDTTSAYTSPTSSTEEDTTDEGSSLPAGCAEALQSIAAFNRMPIESDMVGNSIQFRQLAAGFGVAVDEATDPEVISALETLATDFETAAGHLQAEDFDSYSAMRPEINDDIDALSPACEPG